MSPSTFVILLMCVWLSSATITQFQWSDCGSDPSIIIQKLEVSPMPVHLPGQLHLSIKAGSSQPLGALDLHISLTRHTHLFDVHVPCLMNFGSCTYEVPCLGQSLHSLLDKMISENWAGVSADLARQIRVLLQAMPQLNTTQCPLLPSIVDVENFTFQLRSLPGILAAYVNGDYSMTVTLVDKSSHHTLLCLAIKLSVNVACSGFLCG